MTTVYFFGGYLSTIADVTAWRQSAQKQRPDVDFHIQPWPGGPSDEPLSNWHFGSTRIAGIIKANPDGDYWLVGHSSGCGIANDVAEHAVDVGCENIHLVALDGFRPSLSLLTHFGHGVQCWSAQWDGYRSRNYYALCNTPNFKVYRPERKATSWALHFSLANKNASDSTVWSIETGYADCLANLDWLAPAFEMRKAA